MKNPIELIYQFNKEAGLLDNPYNDFLESSFQVEEALEGFGNLPTLARRIHPEGIFIGDATPKSLSRDIVNLASDAIPMANVDRLDKACDAVVFAVGSMAKLGLNPTQITQALNTVMEANLTKLGMPKDAYGKQTKPESFTGPETKLQEILNECT